MLEQLFDYEIPYWHPLAVHFPVALLSLAAVVAIIWMFSGKQQWRFATLLFEGLGALGAIAAFFTGEELEEDSEGSPMVDLFVEHHERLGKITMIVAIVATALLVGISLRVRKSTPVRADADPLAVRLIAGILVLVAGLLVAITGHLGGTMVWGVPAG